MAMDKCSDGGNCGEGGYCDSCPHSPRCANCDGDVCENHPAPTFLGVPCNGQNLAKAKELRDDAKAMLVLADFYDMDKNEQLVLAAMAEQMVINAQKCT